MKIASFNVNSIRARLSVVTDWLRRNQPEVLAVQETKVQDQDFPRAAFEEIGYQCFFRGQKAYNGVALLTSCDLADVTYGLATEPKDEARLITARVGDVAIVNTYVPQGYLADTDKFQYKLDWFARLHEYIQDRFTPADPLVWVGDLNVAPEPIDVYDPDSLLGHVCFHPRVHQALRRIMDWGFIDGFRLHCRHAGQYTFWDYRQRNSFQRNLGWRLDHIMVTEPAVRACKKCYIDREPRAADRPSDHTPVVAEFDW